MVPDEITVVNAVQIQSVQAQAIGRFSHLRTAVAETVIDAEVTKAERFIICILQLILSVQAITDGGQNRVEWIAVAFEENSGRAMSSETVIDQTSFAADFEWAASVLRERGRVTCFAFLDFVLCLSSIYTWFGSLGLFLAAGPVIGYYGARMLKSGFVGLYFVFKVLTTILCLLLAIDSIGKNKHTPNSLMVLIINLLIRRKSFCTMCGRNLSTCCINRDFPIRINTSKKRNVSR
jgi:hypothetical protein